MKKKLAVSLLFLTLTAGVAGADDTWSPGHKLAVNHRTTWVQKVFSYFHFFKGI
jgi:hypothetical protein